MKISGLFAAVLFILISGAFTAAAQEVGFINSVTIREKFPEAQQAQEKVQSMTDGWKRELDSMQQKIINLENEIEKSRYIWSETEYLNKDAELTALRKNHEDHAKSIFSPNGKYDQAVLEIFTPIEEKIKDSLKQTEEK